MKRLAAFLKKQARNMSEKQAKRILNLVDTDAGRDRATEMRDVLIRTLFDRLESTDIQVALIDVEIAELLEESEYQLRTMPGIGNQIAAVLEAEIGSIDRFKSSSQLARYAGIAPAENSSGTRRRTRHRHYGRRNLNSAFYSVALTQIRLLRDGRPLNPEARSYYEKKLQEGKSPKGALRCLMRRLVDIVYAMMRDRSTYKLPEYQPADLKEVI